MHLSAKHIPTSAQLVGTRATLHISNLFARLAGREQHRCSQNACVADGLPKTEQFTTTGEVRHYLDTVREVLLGNS